MSAHWCMHPLHACVVVSQHCAVLLVVYLVKSSHGTIGIPGQVKASKSVPEGML